MQVNLNVAKLARLAPTIILVNIFFVYTYFYHSKISFPLDDAYIVLHNARSLLSGDDNFANVPPLTGSTSQLFTLAVTLLITCLPDPLALWLLSWAGILAAGLGIANIARNFGNSPRQQWAIVTATLLAGQPFLALLNGVETGWTIAAISWALSLASTQRPDIRLPVICGFLPFVRPELAALAALLMFDQVRRHYVAMQQPADAARPIARDVGVLLIIALPMLVVQWLGGGSPFPNTGPAKLYFFAGSNLPLEQKVTFVLIIVAQFLVILGPAFLSGIMLRTRIGVLGSGFLVIVVGAYTLATPTILFHNDYRYLYLIIPVLAVNLSSALASPRPIWRNSAIVLLVLSITWNIVHLPASAQEYARRSSEKLATMSGLTDWIVANLDPEELILIHDIGYVAYATSQPLNDLVGLKSPENIAIHRAYTRYGGNFARAESTERIALRSGARILVVSTGWEPAFQMAAGLRKRGWSLTLLSTKAFPAGYEVYRITPPKQQ